MLILTAVFIQQKIKNIVANIDLKQQKIPEEFIRIETK